MQHFEATGIAAARYDGTVSRETRDTIKRLFQQGQIPVLVGNQKAGGTGLTLKPAQTVVYYSNYYGLLERLQSEDRPIHGELTRPVLYADLVARTTIEERLVTSLQFKKDIFQELMGDRSRIADWFAQAA
jgi:SNF2 family DNA or RNA helicase